MPSAEMPTPAEIAQGLAALRELREIEAIRQLKYRYMRCLDQKRWDEMRECFSEDATSSYGGGKYSYQGRDAILEFLVTSMGRDDFLSSHRVHHPEIRLTGDDSAEGTWALEDYVIVGEHELTIHGAAWYSDRYVKRDGRWKIQHTGYQRTFEQMQSRKQDPAWRITQRAGGADA